MFITPAYAQGAGGGNDILIQMLPLVAMFVIFYFLLIRPQQRRAQQHRDMVAQIKRGDSIVLSSGIIAKVTKAKEGEAEIEVDIGSNSATLVKVLRGTISDVRNKTEPAKDATT
jgi:preprotein translocase subunit YajC